jgi:predicted DNA-binding transcriptional regulator AlpA
MLPLTGSVRGFLLASNFFISCGHKTSFCFITIRSIEINPINKILREREVISLVGLSRTTIWRLEQIGQFPRRKRVGLRAVGWSLEEIQCWISSLPLAESKEQ